MNRKFSLLATALALISVSQWCHAQHAQSVYSTGNYRSLFNEYDALGAGGLAQWLIDYKLLANYQTYFYYNEADLDDKRIYFEVAGSNPKEGYIKDINSNDIRSEGISYGMIIAVMMDDQPVFDSLWRFAKNRMRRPEGWFAWQLNPTSPYTPKDNNPAPDGEEYMAMALFFAQNRWGNSSLNYSQEANAILEVLRTRLFDSGSGLIKFSPNTSFTDASYHLPHFYELFGQWAASNNQFWKDAATKSRAFLKKAGHTTTGLFPEYSNYDGTPVAANTNGNSNANRFASDAYRVIQNMAIDYYWWSRDPDFVTLVQRQQQFYRNQDNGSGNYKSVYDLNGSNPGSYTSPGHAWMNGVGSLVSSNQLSKDFIQYTPIESLGSHGLYALQPTTGQYRYYDGLLHLLGLLHLSGNFKIYKPGQAALSVDLSADQLNLIQPSVQIVNTTSQTLGNFKARYFLTTENNKTPQVVDYSTPNMDVSVERLNGSLWAVNMNYRNTVLAPGQRVPASGEWDRFGIRYTDSSNMNKANDYSNPTSTKFDSTDRIALYDSNGTLVAGTEPPGVSSTYSIRVRARGTSGNEVINVTVGGTAVASWRLTTNFQDYTVNTTFGGGINVVYINDAANRDVVVDYVAVNNVIQQAEDQTQNTAAFANGRCGGGTRTEWMHCNGYIGFSAFR